MVADSEEGGSRDTAEKVRRGVTERNGYPVSVVTEEGGNGDTAEEV